MGSHANYERCKNNDPRECFNCQYPDCIATTKDINRQDAAETRRKVHEKHDRIVRMYNDGLTAPEIAERIKCERTEVYSALALAKKKGVEVRRSTHGRKKKTAGQTDEGKGERCLISQRLKNTKNIKG